MSVRCDARAVDETTPTCGVRNDVSSTSDAELTSRAEATSEACFNNFQQFHTFLHGTVLDFCRWKMTD